MPLSDHSPPTRKGGSSNTARGLHLTYSLANATQCLRTVPRTCYYVLNSYFNKHIKKRQTRKGRNAKSRQKNTIKMRKEKKLK